MKLIFEILAKIYNILSTNFENIFYRKFKPKNELELKGFTVLRNELKSIIDYSRTDYLVVNKYLRKLIFSNDDIEKILKKLFISEKLFDKITKLTGFNYSVDFLIAYETLPISDEDKSKGWYANHIHNDKPFSKNTLKLIIPLETIESDNGPMEIISKENKINQREVIILKENVNKRQTNIVDVCTILEKCSIDEITKYLLKQGKKKGFPDITTRQY